MTWLGIHKALEHEPNHFALVMLASQRTRSLMRGARPRVRHEGSSLSLVALQELEHGLAWSRPPVNDILQEYIDASSLELDVRPWEQAFELAPDSTSRNDSADEQWSPEVPGRVAITLLGASPDGVPTGNEVTLRLTLELDRSEPLRALVSAPDASLEPAIQDIRPGAPADFVFSLPKPGQYRFAVLIVSGTSTLGESHFVLTGRDNVRVLKLRNETEQKSETTLPSFQDIELPPRSRIFYSAAEAVRVFLLPVADDVFQTTIDLTLDPRHEDEKAALESGLGSTFQYYVRVNLRAQAEALADAFRVDRRGNLRRIQELSSYVYQTLFAPTACARDTLDESALELIRRVLQSKFSRPHEILVRCQIIFPWGALFGPHDFWGCVHSVQTACYRANVSFFTFLPPVPQVLKVVSRRHEGTKKHSEILALRSAKPATTSTELLRELKGLKHDCVYLFGHLETEAEVPQARYFVFDREKLSAAELQGLRYNNQQRSGPILALLNTCESAPSGEWVADSFAGALLSGVGRYCPVLAVAPIDAAPAVQWAKAFWHHLVGQQLTVGDSVRGATAELVQSGRSDGLAYVTLGAISTAVVPKLEG
jgi:DNA-directed RNA polymerase subunit K/omega